jgi:hypothetical protein
MGFVELGLLGFNITTQANKTAREGTLGYCNGVLKVEPKKPG